MLFMLIFLPLIGAVISGLFYIINLTTNVKIKDFLTTFSYIISSLCIVISLYFMVLTFNKILINGEIQVYSLFHWLTLGKTSIFWIFSFDTLTTLMSLIVYIISLAVFIYSYGYMKGSKDSAKFISYLGFFVFFMIFLVTSENLLQMFIGWEGISLFSYLLISFLYKNQRAVPSAIKSFVVNRVADVAFLLGIFTCYNVFSTLDLYSIFSQSSVAINQIILIGSIKISVVNIIALCFLIAAMGKSAQFLFHVWLPDAMEAPTPVSALLHAATMVTAGVFLIIKLSPLFSSAQYVLAIMAVVGLLTAFIGGSIAMTSNNLKKIIAYSTISQLGYMFIALGNNFYNGAIFHIFTHAFFKATLFLGAGIIIHILDGEQDIRKMGALWKKIPIVYFCMVLATLSLNAIPPFSGFYSKEMILHNLLFTNSTLNNFLYYLGSFASFFTAVYSFKLIALVFHGKSNSSHIHKNNSLSMNIPVVIIAVASIFVGKLYFNNFVGNSTEMFWKHVIYLQQTKEEAVSSIIKNNLPFIFMILGVIVSYMIFIKKYDVKSNFSRLYNFLYNEWYFNKIYEYVFYRGVIKLSRILKVFETKVVDFVFANLWARIAYRLSVFVNSLQTGYFYHYIFVIFLVLFSSLATLIFLLIF